MPDPRNPDIWNMVFDQTPAALRWALGVLTLGVFTLLSVLYRWHRDDMTKMHSRVDRLERRMEAQHVETNRLLMQISHNTRPDA